ncbi:SDR family oxidoreductase [Pontiellaceae bacterium B1224]|nr:SDR family oxidoreductase [Pontiellaceae bacterium B1224]
MTVFIVGASGATGSLLVELLLDCGHHVKAVVRRPERMPEGLRNYPNLTLIQASILDLSDAEMIAYVKGCDAVASCLGHNLTLKGMFGAPHMLVTETTRRLCAAIRSSQPATAVRFVLMNTTGNRNRDLAEPISFGQRIVILLLRLLLPPHRDNERAADVLRRQVGQNDRQIEWVAVRPDNLVDQADVSDYELHASPIRSAILDAGETSRINVSHFMAELISVHATWYQWKGQMPVIYNTEA